MGCFSSCHKHTDDFPNIEKRFSGIEIKEASDESSDDTLKADIDKPNKDVTPLLEGNTLLAFKNLDLSSSSSIDLELNQINNMLKLQDESKDKEEDKSKSLNASDDDHIENRTFGAAAVPSDEEN